MQGFDENEVYDKKQVETSEVKCASCGANMVFDPGTQTLYCDHCGTRKEISHDKNVQEIDINRAFEKSETWERETVLFRCNNCGAKVILEKNVSAKHCPFCGTSHIVKSEELPGLKPNAVLPFLITVENAIQRCIAWAKKKIFAPRKFKKNLSPENVSGLYFPCFTFDSSTDSRYHGRLGKRYTVTVGSGKNRRTETRIRYFNVNGSYAQFFDDIMIAAGDAIDQKAMRKLSPFVLKQSCVYSDKYLSGFMANHYDKEIKTAWGEAKTTMDKVIRQRILSKYHADVVDYLDVATVHNNVTYKYMLLPVYLGNYTYKEKVYNFYQNGSTGKMAGKAPVSPLRVLAAVGIGAAVVGLLGLLAFLLL